MSGMSKLRKRVAYDADPPRCENCKQYRRPGEYLRDSLPRVSPPQCKLHHFIVSPVACCDRWAGADGSVLA